MAPLAAELIAFFGLAEGSAVLSAAFPELGIGFTGVSLAFGLTVLTGAYLSDPFRAVTSIRRYLWLWAGGRFPGSKLLPYVSRKCWVQSSLRVAISSRAERPASICKWLRLGGYGEHSPASTAWSALVCEVVMTFMFVIVIGVRRGRAPTDFAGIAIGLCLTLIHLVSIL